MHTARRAFVTLIAALAVLIGSVTPAQAGGVSTGSIVGTVVGPAGPIDYVEGVQSVSITVQPVDSPVSVGFARADSTGAFSIADVPAGSYHLQVRYFGPDNVISNWAPGVYLKTEAQVYTVGAGAELDLALELQAGASVTGTVTREGGGVGAQVWAVQSSGPPYAGIDQHRFTTDATTGAYVVDRIVPGTYTVSMFADFDRYFGLQWPSRWGGEGVATPITLASGEVRSGIDAELPLTSTIEGTLTVPAGGPPVTNQTVVLRQNGTWYDSELVGSDGRFSFTGITGDGFTLCTREPEVPGYIGSTCWHPELGMSRDPQPFSMDRADRYLDVDYPLATGGLLIFDARPLDSNGEFSGWFDGDATLYKLDESDGFFYPTRTITAGDPPYYDDHSFMIPALEPGEYRIQLTAESMFEWFGRLYYPGTRVWADAGPVFITEFETTELPTMPVTWKTYDTRRIAGASRYDTAVEISKNTLVTPPVPVVYVASGASYPDALAAGPAAAVQGGVLLLTPPNGLTAALRDELERLDPDRIVVAGGAGSVSEAVRLELQAFVDAPGLVERLGGADRYETSRLIVADAFGQSEGRVAFVATGENFPDALAAGPAAAHFGGPVILTRGSLSSLDAPTRALLDALQPAAIVIAGGTGTVSAGIESSLRSRYGARADVIRAPGKDRYETATIINLISFVEAENALYASGTGFADALAGGTLAASMQAPLYLVNRDCVPEFVRQHVDDLGVFTIRILGGTGVLAEPIDRGVPCS